MKNEEREILDELVCYLSRSIIEKESTPKQIKMMFTTQLVDSKNSELLDFIRDIDIHNEAYDTYYSEIINASNDLIYKINSLLAVIKSED